MARRNLVLRHSASLGQAAGWRHALALCYGSGSESDCVTWGCVLTRVYWHLFVEIAAAICVDFFLHCSLSARLAQVSMITPQSLKSCCHRATGPGGLAALQPGTSTRPQMHSEMLHIAVLLCCPSKHVWTSNEETRQPHMCHMGYQTLWVLGWTPVCMPTTCSAGPKLMFHGDVGFLKHI